MMLGLCLRRLAACAVLAVASSQTFAQTSPKVKPVPDVVEAAFRWGDFAELERLYATYGRASVRSELTGVSRLKHFWTGIGKVSNSTLQVSDDYFQQLSAFTHRWSREYPDSVLAQLLYAHALYEHAWAIRGAGYSNTVSAAARSEYLKQLELAATHLANIESLARKDSHWNELMMKVGVSLGWDRDRVAALFEQGLAKDPDNEDLYFEMQRGLLPKWGGDVRTVERFIEVAVRNTRERLGMEMYARLYAALSYSQVSHALFTDTRASWVGMKAGFEDRLKRYPHVDHRNMYAHFACMAEDRPTLREQLALIGDRFERWFWGDNPERTFELCKRMAQQV